MSYPYTPPAGNAANFNFNQVGYVPPAAATVNISFSANAMSATIAMALALAGTAGTQTVNQYSMFLIFN